MTEDAPSMQTDDDIVLRDVVVGSEVKVGNVTAGELVGGAVIQGSANTITVLEHSPQIAMQDVSVGRDFVISFTQEKEVLPGFDLAKEAQEIQRQPKEVLTSEQALTRIAEKTAFDINQLQQNMEQARRESGQFFRVTLIFAGVGSAVVIGGICLMIAGFSTAGAVTTAASLIPQATALLMFNKDKELRKTIETYHSQISESQKVLTMIDVAETMSDDAKDSVKEQMVLAVLRVSPARPSTRKRPVSVQKS